MPAGNVGDRLVGLCLRRASRRRRPLPRRLVRSGFWCGNWRRRFEQRRRCEQRRYFEQREWLDGWPRRGAATATGADRTPAPATAQRVSNPGGDPRGRRLCAMRRRLVPTRGCCDLREQAAARGANRISILDRLLVRRRLYGPGAWALQLRHLLLRLHDRRRVRARGGVLLH
jgi:hypothetical protein